MSKHLIDGDRCVQRSARAERFLNIEAGRSPSPQAKRLQRRPLGNDANARARRYLAIERKRTGYSLA